MNSIEKRTMMNFCNEITKTFSQINANSEKNLIKFKLTLFFLHSIYVLCQNSKSVVDKEWNQILILYKTFLSSKSKIFQSQKDLGYKMNDYFSKIYHKIYRNEFLLKSLTGNDEYELLLNTISNLIEEPAEYLYYAMNNFDLFDVFLRSISTNNFVLESNDFRNTIEILMVMRISQNLDSQLLKSFDQRIANGVLQKKSAALAIVCIHVILQRLR